MTWYIVLKHNQAGGWPRVANEDLFDNLDEALSDARGRQLDASPRRDRYTVAKLLLEEDDL